MTDLDRLIAAARAGDVETAQSTLDATPDLVRRKDATGATALHYAAFEGHRRLAQLLVERGADVNARDDRHGATPAGWAIEYLRELHGQLGIELADVAYAIEAGDVRWAKRFLDRFPWLRSEFREQALATADPAMIALFDEAKSQPDL